jgi:hypothetical protein
MPSLCFVACNGNAWQSFEVAARAFRGSTSGFAIKRVMKDWTILIPIVTLIFILVGLVHGITYAFRRREK